MQLAEVSLVQEELRQHRILSGGADVLQFHQTLWFSWLSLFERLGRMSNLSLEIAVPPATPFHNTGPQEKPHSDHLQHDVLEEAVPDVDQWFVE